MTSVVQWAVSGIGILASLAWFIQVLALVRHRKEAHWLADLSDSLPERAWPGLTVIFAARDEAPGVEWAARSILAQDYLDLRVIAVDDRSSDATGVILESIAGEDSRLRVVHIDELPGGWLGKTHALHVAARAESSPWLLFTDADVQFAPGTLRRAVAWALETGADHVTVVPEFATEGVGERLLLMIIALAFASRVLGGRVGAGGRSHLGIGAFNLVRRAAFHGIGGFEHLALSVDDDNRLAQALALSGYRGRAILGKGAVSVRWHTGLVGLIRGLEKNLFAFVDFRTGIVALVGPLWICMCAPYVGLFVGPWWIRIICGIGVASVAVVLSAIRRQTGIAWYYALALPVGIVLYVFTFSRSAWLTLRRRGVSWRGRHYPLSELREHVRLRNAWLRLVRANVQVRLSRVGETHKDHGI